MKWIDDLVQACSHFDAPEKHVLGIAGSPRKGGNSDILLKSILSGVAEKKIPAAPVQLRRLQYQGCVGCERCRKDRCCTGLQDGMSLIYPDIIRSQGLILVSPTHNYNVTAWMKAFIDRLYCFYHFDDHRPRGWTSRLAGQGRKAVLAAVCEQENRTDMGFTLDAMRLPIEALGYTVVGELAVLNIFDRGKVKDSADIMADARKMGIELAEALSTAS